MQTLLSEGGCRWFDSTRTDHETREEPMGSANTPGAAEGLLKTGAAPLAGQLRTLTARLLFYRDQPSGWRPAGTIGPRTRRCRAPTSRNKFGRFVPLPAVVRHTHALDRRAGRAAEVLLRRRPTAGR